MVFLFCIIAWIHEKKKEIFVSLIAERQEKLWYDRERKNEIRGVGIKGIAPGKCGGKNEHHGRAFTEAAGFYS